MRAQRSLMAFVVLVACGAAPSPRTSTARVVSQVVFADEELWHLGPEVRSRVVGVSPMADDPRYSDAQGLWPDPVARPAGAEAIVALAPDLVVTAEFTSAETRAVLEQIGIRTLQLDGWNGFDDYRAHVTALAAALDATDAGGRRVAEFDGALAAMRSQFAGSDQPGAVSWQEGSVAGSGTFFADAAAAAGFVNVAGQAGIHGHRTVAVETLVAWNPEYIVIPCDDDCTEREREFAGRPGIAATRAAQRGGIVAIPARHLYSVGFGMLEVVRQLGNRRAEAQQ